jgi:hypothetical protein
MQIDLPPNGFVYRDSLVTPSWLERLVFKYIMAFLFAMLISGIKTYTSDRQVLQDVLLKCTSRDSIKNWLGAKCTALTTVASQHIPKTIRNKKNCYRL